MEALLKLIVGLDGATAEMVVQLGWVYLAAKAANGLFILTGFGIIGAVVLKGQRAFFAYDTAKHGARNGR